LKISPVAAVLLACCLAGSGLSQDSAEQALNARIQSSNGIAVGAPKIYDDSALQQMLAAMQARLASLQVLDQGTLINRVGGVSGVSQQLNSFAITAQTPSLPGVTTTEKGPTLSAVETSKTVEGTERTIPTGASALATTNETGSTDRAMQTTAGAATRDAVTAAPQFSVSPPTAAPAAIATPTAAGVSASDALNEQMQLSFEIANLRLLLEGSLSDRMLKSTKDNLKLVKPRTTIGFPITLQPDQRHKNAVAVVEVEVEVEESADLGGGEAPAITALLPREKTYNTASITESNVSAGGGVVTQVIGLGGSWLRGRRTYYVVQDQDTLATTFQPAKAGRSGFAWQFRPVLGRECVRSAEKQTFVQLAFPTSDGAEKFGRVYVRTYWRKYDRGKGLLKEVLPGSLRENSLVWDIRNYGAIMDAANGPRGFGADSIEDQGDGQVLVRLSQRFLGSTYVRIGNTIVREGSGLTFEHFGMRFAARLSDAVSKRIMVVGRDGSETPLVIKRTVAGTQEPRADPPRISGHQVTALDESNTLLRLDLCDKQQLEIHPPLVIVAGGKVYGYSDAPIERDLNKGTLSAVIPTAVLAAQPEVTVTWLFADPRLAVRHQVHEFSRASRTEQLILLEQGSSWAKFLLYGSRLSQATVLHPEGVKMLPFGRPEDAGSLRMLEMTADQIKSHRRIAVSRPGERPMLIEVPAVEFKAGAKKELKAKERIVVGSDEAVFEGEGLDKLKQVLFRKLPVPFEAAKDGKSVRLKNLKALGVTSSAVAQDLVFTFEAAQTPVSVEVVSAKLETVGR
jgi:hypothetical protein